MTAAVSGEPAKLVFAVMLLYYCPMLHAYIDEVFASVQGEGPWAGQRHLFVRFLGCDLRCAYCDTPESVKVPPVDGGRPCRAQVSAHSFDRQEVPNPVSAGVLDGLCERLLVPGPSRPVVSLTGGEPLLQHAFLAEWLPAARQRYRVYLETSGIHHEEMRPLSGLVDVVSMDIKLPSATGQQARWDEHRRFLAAAGPGLFVKVVVTKATSDDDVVTAARLLAEHDGRLPFVLQPASGVFAPLPTDLVRFQTIALGLLEDVRVIPQLHKVLGLP